MQVHSQVEGYDYAEQSRNKPRSPNMMLTEKQLSELSHKLGSEWEQLVSRLGLSRNDIYKCKVENQYNIWAQIQASLIKWRNREYKQATIGRLVTELQRCEVGREVYEFLMHV